MKFVVIIIFVIPLCDQTMIVIFCQFTLSSVFKLFAFLPVEYKQYEDIEMQNTKEMQEIFEDITA